MGVLTEKNVELQKRAYAECGKIAPAMLFGDYYPLTPYSLKLDQWIAWQFDRPEQGEGLVQAFRRPECKNESIRFYLHGLEPDATYGLTNFDKAGSSEMTGRALMDNGLEILATECPAAIVMTYEKKRSS